MERELPIKVLLVDDHEMVRIGLSAMLSTEEGIEVVGEASSGEEAIKLSRAYRPDVVLMDLVMEGMDGIETTRKILEELNDCKVIVLTSYIDEEKIYPALEAGAFSYLLKTSRAGEIAKAIYEAMEGKATLEPQVAAKLVRHLSHSAHEKALHEALTEREMEVLKLIAQGKTNQEVAEELHIGVKTVKYHLTNIFSKLQVEDRTQAAIYAHQHGLVK